MANSKEVITLNQQNFDEQLSSGLWLVEFYAPWCGHCKHLAPVLDEVAEATAGRMKIGKIDGTVEKSLNSKYAVQGYPSLFYSNHGKPLKPYQGSRESASLKSFASRMSKDAVQIVADESALKLEMKKISSLNGDNNKAVAFLLCAKKEDAGNPLVISYKKASIALQAEIDAFSTSNESLCSESTLPFIKKVEEELGSKLYIENNNYENMEEWLLANKWNQVVELNGGNYASISNNGQLLVIAMVDYKDKATFNKSIAKLNTISSSPKIASNLISKFQFSYLDGVRWSGFVSQYEVLTLPSIIVLDSKNKLFYSNQEEITSLDKWETFILNVATGVESAKYEGWRGGFRTLSRWFYSSQPWSSLVVVGGLALFGASVYIIIQICSTTNEEEEKKDKPEGGKGEEHSETKKEK